VAGLGGFELADDDFPDKHCLPATVMSSELIEKAELPNESTKDCGSTWRKNGEMPEVLSGEQHNYLILLALPRGLEPLFSP
jgi:hypothetical protein